jgi:hypothetical protein
MCLDCDNLYPCHFRHVESPDDKTEPSESPKSKELRTKNKKTILDYRAEIPVAVRPNAQFNERLVEVALAQGPAGIRQAQRIALKYARQFAQEAEDRWRRVTPWLAAKQSDTSDFRARSGARFALAWRPKFLAALSMTRAPTLAARFAKITRDTAYAHRKQDAEFAQQWEDAQEEAVELLHARTFQRAIEGDCEPILYMGVPVAYVRKFSDKLQIEMLRAYRPDTFKTAGVNVNLGVKGDVFVLSEEQRHKLIEINREFLMDPSTLKDADGQFAHVDPQRLTTHGAHD